MGGYSEPQTTSSSGDSEIKAPETKPEEGTFGGTLWQIIGKQLGSDVLRIGGTALKSQSNPLVSLPSWMYEPLSSLQRHTEMLEYSEILDRAAKTTDPVERMALVAAFAVTAYSATPVRLSMLFKHSSLTSKGPTFNPILGETYEYIDKKTNMKFFAEQVLLTQFVPVLNYSKRSATTPLLPQFMWKAMGGVSFRILLLPPSSLEIPLTSLPKETPTSNFQMEITSIM